MPQNCCGRVSGSASSVMGSVEVLEQMIADGLILVSTSVSTLCLTFIFSGAIGSALPGAVYMSQKITFLTQITQKTLIQPAISIKKDLGRGRYLLQTDLKDQNDHTLAQGEALILYVND